MKGFRKRTLVSKLMIIMVMLLLLIGLVQLYSSVYSAGISDMGIFYKQLIWIGIGLVIGFIAFLLNPTWLIKHSKYIYLLSVFALLSILVFQRLGFSTTRWLTVGSLNFQPSEVAKLSLIFYLVFIFSKTKPRNITDLIYPFAITLIPTVLISLQPDLGTALVFPLIFVFMLFLTRPPLYIILSLISFICALVFGIIGFKFALIYLGIFIVVFLILRTNLRDLIIIATLNVALTIVSPFLWYLLKDYQKMRILSFINPTADPLGAGYNIIQSQIAVGSGQLFGRGFLRGSQTHLKFLPVQHTDFIFSVLAEEWGFIGCLITIVIFTVLLIKIFNITQKKMRQEYKFLAFGIFSLLFIHIYVNIGMSLGLMPVTGLPLPFFSYGGSFMVVVLFCVGLLLGVEYREYYYR